MKYGKRSKPNFTKWALIQFFTSILSLALKIGMYALFQAGDLIFVPPTSYTLATSPIQQFRWQDQSAKCFDNVNIIWCTIIHTKYPLCDLRIPLQWNHCKVSQIMIKGSITRCQHSTYHNVTIFSQRDIGTWGELLCNLTQIIKNITSVLCNHVTNKG